MIVNTILVALAVILQVATLLLAFTVGALAEEAQKGWKNEESRVRAGALTILAATFACLTIIVAFAV